MPASSDRWDERLDGLDAGSAGWRLRAAAGGARGRSAEHVGEAGCPASLGLSTGMPNGAAHGAEDVDDRVDDRVMFGSQRRTSR
jgi:hypothetical protein